MSLTSNPKIKIQAAYDTYKGDVSEDEDIVVSPEQTTSPFKRFRPGEVNPEEIAARFRRCLPVAKKAKARNKTQAKQLPQVRRPKIIKRLPQEALQEIAKPSAPSRHAPKFYCAGKPRHPEQKKREKTPKHFRRDNELVFRVPNLPMQPYLICEMFDIRLRVETVWGPASILEYRTKTGAKDRCWFYDIDLARQPSQVAHKLRTHGLQIVDSVRAHRAFRKYLTARVKTIDPISMIKAEAESYFGMGAPDAPMAHQEDDVLS